ATRGKAGDMERLMRLGRIGIALMWAFAMVTAWGVIALGDVSAAAGRAVDGPSALFKDGRSGDDNGADDVNDDNGGHDGDDVVDDSGDDLNDDHGGDNVDDGTDDSGNDVNDDNG